MKKALRGICWLHTGQWPLFIGICCDEKAFRAKIASLGMEYNDDFIPERGHAATHYFMHPDQGLIQIMAIRTPKKTGRTPESYASLVAHEAVHMLQELKERISPHEPFGREAEAYFVQHVVMEALAFLNETGMTKVHSPR